MNMFSYPKVLTVGYLNVDAGEKLASWMSDPMTLLIDIRCSPESHLSDWQGEALQRRYERRYRWAGEYLGNVNHKIKNAPIQLANERAGIRGLQLYLEKGFTLVLLCGCRDYERCHRKSVVEALLVATPDVVIEPELPALPGKKCITVRQPYSHWLVHPELFCSANIQPKTVENRTWRVKYRGELFIHAGSTFEAGAIEYWLEKVPQLAGVISQRVEDYTLGAIVGVVDLVDIIQESSNPWHMPGQHGWVLANARAIEPIPMKGRQGLFEVSPNLVGGVL